MLKNKIIVKKIRNILILLMAIIIMIGAYKNIDKSKAEEIIELDAIALDNYGYLADELFKLEAKEIEDEMYEIELPESINSKKINQIVKVTLDEYVSEDMNIETPVESNLEGENTETPTQENENPENINPENVTEEENGLEIVGNKIYLTGEEIDENQINIEVVYDIAILEEKEDDQREKILLSEKTAEERAQLETAGIIGPTANTPENAKVLYNKILRYEDEENGKLVELKGLLPIDAELLVEKVEKQQLAEILKGDQTKVDVAYNIKIIIKNVTQVPVDEANPDSEIEEIVEIIEINPEDYGEICEVSIKDAKIAENSQVYHVKEDNTVEQVNVKESIDGNISFEAQTFSVYFVTDEEIDATDGADTEQEPDTEIETPRPPQTGAANITAQATAVTHTNQSSVTIYATITQGSESLSKVIISGFSGYPWVQHSLRQEAQYDPATNRYYSTFNFSSIPDTSSGATNQGEVQYNFDVSVVDTEGYETVVSGCSVTYDTAKPYWEIQNLFINNGIATMDIVGKDNYATGSSTLDASNIHWFEDGVESYVTNETLTKTGTTTYQYTVSLINDRILPGKEYRGLSGNLVMKIDAGTLTDAAGNTNNAFQTDGVEFDEVKPDVVYKYSRGDINQGNKTVTIVFSIVDKSGISSSSLTAENLTIKFDGTTPDWSKATRTLTSTDISYGKQYTLVLGNLDQGAGFDYSGVVTVGIPAGVATDGKGNSNTAKTITVGIDLKGDVGSSTAATGGVPYIPNGFSYVEGSLSTGVVVQDSKGNQFVWVEVPKTTTVYPTAGLNLTTFTDADIEKIKTDLKSYTSTYDLSGYSEDDTNYSGTGLTNEEYNTLLKKMLVSVYKNGGFYVGRYETGIEGDSHRTDKSQTLQTPVIQQHKYPYNFIEIDEAQQISNIFAPQGYTSNMMFGIQWNLVMKYLQTKGTDVTSNSAGWGNYYNSTFTTIDANAKFSTDSTMSYRDSQEFQSTAGSVLLTTGANEAFKKQNIYDLAGNFHEMTLQYSNSTSEPTVLRGGEGGVALPDYSANAYSSISTTDGTNALNAVGFRVALFKEESIIADVVDPIWEIKNINATLNKTSGNVELTADLIAQDKYFNASSLQTSDIKVLVGGAEKTVTTTFVSTSDVTNGKKYSIKVTGSGIASVGQTLTLRIPAGTLTDKSGNTNLQKESSITFTDSVQMTLATSNTNYTLNQYTKENVKITGKTVSGYTVTHSSYKKDGSAVATNVAAATTTTLSGTNQYTVKGKATKTSGDDTTTVTIVYEPVLIDQTAPEAGTMTFKNADGTTYTPGNWTNQTVNLTLANGKDESGIVNSGHNTTTYTMKKNGTAISNITSLTGEGIYEITITTTDKVGNSSTRTYSNIKIDKTNPAWEYVGKDIYYTTANDVGTDDYTNSERIVKITFKGVGTNTSIDPTNVTSSLTAALIDVRVNGTAVADSKKTLATTNNGTTEVTHTLTLTGLTGDAPLSVVIPANSLTDDAGNKNSSAKTLTTDINIVVDNTPPTLRLSATQLTAGTVGNVITIMARYDDAIFTTKYAKEQIDAKAEAPTMTATFGGTAAKGTLSKESVVYDSTNNQTMVTYKYTVVSGDSGALKVSVGNAYDIAGNAVSATNVTPIQSVKIEVTSPETGFYKAGQTVTVKATYVGRIYKEASKTTQIDATGEQPALTLKFADSGAAKGSVSCSSVSYNSSTDTTVITYTYPITSGDNGVLSVSNLAKVYDSDAFEITISDVAPSGYVITADTIAPTAGTMTFKNADGTTYTPGANSWTKQNVTLTLTNGYDTAGTTNSGHKSTAYSINGAASVTTTPNTLGEGKHTIVVTTTDVAGNTATNTYQVNIDQTNPTAGTMTFNNGNYTAGNWTNQTVNLTLANGSDTAGVVNSDHKSTDYTIKKNGEEISKTTSLTEEGMYEITITTTDNAGNTDTRKYYVNIDKTRPVWTYSSKDIYYSNPNDAGNDNYANRERTVVVTFKGTDGYIGGTNNVVTSTLAKSQIVVKVNGNTVAESNKNLSLTGSGTTEITGTLTLTGITGDGDLSVAINADTLSDKSGNTNVQKSLSTNIVYDNISPQLRVTTNILTGASYNVGQTIKLVATYNDEEYTDGVFKEITSNTRITAPAHAPAMSIKFGGQVAKGTATATSVNTSKPGKTRVTYEYVIQSGDVGNITVTIPSVYDHAGNEISATNVTPTLNVTIEVTAPEPSGYYKEGQEITLKATYAGDIYKEESATTLIDTVGEAPTLKLQFGNTLAKGGNATCTSVNDGEFIYKYTITNGDNGLLYVNNLSTVYDADGFDIVIDDIQLPTGFQITADTTNPTLTVENSSNGNWTNQDVVITATYQDPNPGGSGLKEILYSWDQATWESGWDSTTNAPGAAEVQGTAIKTWTEEINKTLYVKAVDQLGHETIVTTPVKIDKTNPTVSINPTSGPDIIKQHSVIITLADQSGTVNSGLAQGAILKYGWSTSATEAPTYTTENLVYSTGADGKSVTVITPNQTGIHYLWVYAEGVTDQAGNSVTTTITSEAFNVDLTPPTVSLSQTQNTTWAQSHTVTVTMADDGTNPYSGLGENIQIQYGWSTSKTTAPTYTTAELTYTAGDGSTTFEAVTPAETGKFYLWVVPTDVKDVAGNQTDTTPIVTDDFWVDVTPPEWTIQNVNKTNPTVTLDIIGTDAHSGYAGDTLSTGDILVEVDKEYAGSISKSLSDPTYYKADGTVTTNESEAASVKYTLTLTGWEQSSKQDGKSWYEWSGTTHVGILPGCLTDKAGNSNEADGGSIGHVDFIKPKIESGSISGNTATFKVIDKYIDETDQVTKDEITAIYIDGTKIDNITKDSLTRAEIKGTVDGVEKVVGHTYTLTLGNLNQSKTEFTAGNNIGSADTSIAYGQYAEYSGTLQVDIAEGAAKDTTGNVTNAVTKKSLGFMDTLSPLVTYRYMGVSRNDKHESASTNPDIDYGQELDEPDENDNTFRMIFDITDKYYNTSTGTLTTSMTREQILQYLTIKIDGQDISALVVEDPRLEVKIEKVEDVYAYGTIKKTVNGSIKSVTATSTDTSIKNAAKIGKRYTLRIKNLEQVFRNEEGYTDYSGVITVALKSELVKDTSGKGNGAKTITSGIHLTEGNVAGGSQKVVDVVNPIVTRTASSMDEANGRLTMGIIVTDKYFDTNDTITNTELSVYINDVKYTSAVITVTEATEKLTTESGRVYGEQYNLVATGLPADVSELKVRVKKGAIYDQYDNPNLEIDLGLESYLRITKDETEPNSPFLNNRRGVTRNLIEKVIFESSTAGMDHSTKWDVSDQQDESIWGWTTIDETTGKYIVHIASDLGTINANPDSSYLFSYVGTGSTSETVIENLDFLQVAAVENMSYMFSNFAYGNPNMEYFYLGESFDTTLVENMKGMFQNCGYTGMKSLDLGDQFLVENVEDMSNMFNGCGYTAMTSLDLGQSFSQIPNQTVTEKDGSTHSPYEGFATNVGKTGECIIYAPEKIYSSSTKFKTITGTAVSCTRATINAKYAPVWEIVSSSLTDAGVMTIIVKGHATKDFDIGNSITDPQEFYKSPITHSLTTSNVVAYVDSEKAQTVRIDSVTMVPNSEVQGTFLVVDDDGNFKEVTGIKEVQYEIVLSNFVENALQTGKTYMEWSGNVSLQFAAGTLRDYYGNRNVPGQRAAGTTVDKETPGVPFVDDIKPVIQWVSATKDPTAKTQTIVFDVIDKYLDTTTAGRVVESEITVYVDGETASNVTKTISRSNLVREGTSRKVGERYTLTLSNFGRAMNSKGYQDWSGTVTLDIAAGAAKDKTGNVSDAVTGMKGTYSDFLAPAIKYTHASSDIANKVYTMTFTVTDKYYKSSGSTPFTTADITNGNIVVKMQNGQRDASGNLIVYNLKDLASEGVTMTLTSAELRVPSMKMTTNEANLTVGTVTNQLIGHTYQLVISNLDQAFIEEGATTANYSGVIMVTLPKDRIIDTTGNKNATTTITSGISQSAGSTSGSATEIDVVAPIVDVVEKSINPLAGTAEVTIRVTDTYFKASDALTSGEINVIVNGTKVTSGLTKTVTKTEPLKEIRVKNDGLKADGKTPETETEEVQYGADITFTISGINTGAHQVKVQIAENALKDITGNGNLETEFILFNTLKVTASETEGTSLFLGITGITRAYIEKVTFLERMPTPDDVGKTGDFGTYNGTFENEKPKVDSTKVWDVSAQQDKTIVAWYTGSSPYQVYIASDEIICANKNSAYLFTYIGQNSSCTVTTMPIVNLNLLNTTSVTNMNGMFRFFGAAKMTKFDLGDNFYTSNVTNMAVMFGDTGYKAMTEMNLGPNFDTSKVTDMNNMFWNCGAGALKSLDLGDKFDTSKVTNMENMFRTLGKSKLETIDLGDKFDTSQVTNMNYMFNEFGKSKLKSINLGSKFNTSKVTKMNHMFYGLARNSTTFKTLSLGSNFDTSLVTDMGYMFAECGYKAMETLTLGSKFNASKATDMSYMFNSCGYTAMKSLTLPDTFNASAAEATMESMFESCGYTAMTSLNLGANFNAINATSMYRMFRNCGKTAMITLDLGNNFGGNKVTNMCGMFENCGYTAMTTLKLGNNFNTSSATDMSFMFVSCGYTAMTSLNLGSNFYTSKVTTMQQMFQNCGNGAMKSLTFGSNFNTEKVKNMNLMFERCGYTAMTSLTLPDNFNAKAATNMTQMFSRCGYTAMTSLNLGANFNAIAATHMTQMFEYVGYTAMTSMNLGANFGGNSAIYMQNMFNSCGYTAMTTLTLGANFDTSSAQNMTSMFYNCGRSALTSLSLGNKFDTSNVTTMQNMFQYCGKGAMTSLDLGPNFNTIKVTNMYNMFSECGKFTKLDLGDKFDTRNVTNMRAMFKIVGNRQAQTIDFGDKFDTSKVQNMCYMFENSNSLKEIDLGDLFDTSSVTNMIGMFTNCSSLTMLDLGPKFVIPSGKAMTWDNKEVDAWYNMFINTGASSCVIFAPEAIYKTGSTFKTSATDTTNEVPWGRGTINPIYRPKWEKVSATLNTATAGGKLEITAKGVASESIELSDNVKINYSSNITAASNIKTILGNAKVFIDGVDVTSTTKPTIAIDTSAVTTSATEVTGYKVTLSNFEEAVRQTGRPFKEWSGNVVIQIDGRGEATSTYTKNVLKDTYGNQSMAEINVGSRWIATGIEDEPVTANTANTMFADIIKPEIRYESANTTVTGLPDSANAADAEKYVTVVFDVLDKYFASSTLAKTDITLKLKDTNTTVDATKFTKTLNLKTIASETTNATSKLTYKTNGDIYFDTDGDGTKEKVGQRYELVISGLDQGNGFDYSGPMNITFASGKVKDTSNNENNSWTITIGISETDGDDTDGGDSGTQQIIDIVNPAWTVGEKKTETVNGVTSAYIKLIVTDKYFKTSTLQSKKNDIIIQIAGEEKTLSEVGATLTGPTSTTNGHVYEISLSAVEETYASFLTQRDNYLTDPTTGRLHREYGGKLDVIIPKGVATDKYGNDSEELSIDLGYVDTLKPEVVKVSSSVEIVQDEQDTNNILDSKYTVVFDITDKFFASSTISETDTSKIRVLFDRVEGDSITKPTAEELAADTEGSLNNKIYKEIKDIEELYSNINGNNTKVGYRYTVEITNFKDAIRRDGVNYTDWSGNIAIQVDSGAATDANGSSNETTILPAETEATAASGKRPVDLNAEQDDFMDVVVPDITYIFSQTDIDYYNKKFIMQFRITDKHYDSNNASTKKALNLTSISQDDIENSGATAPGENDINILIDAKDGRGFQSFNSSVVKELTQTDGENGRYYTITLSNLEQEIIQYSGVVSVLIPSKIVYDTTGGSDTKALYNYGTTLTSGIDVKGEPDPDDQEEFIDLIDPVWNKVETSANAIDQTASITIKATDNKVLYDYDYKSELIPVPELVPDVKYSTLTADDIEVYVDGSKKSITPTVELIEETTRSWEVIIDRTSEDRVIEERDLLYTAEYKISISGFAANASQVKIRIKQGAIRDDAENESKTTDFIAYNCLKKTDTETTATVGFLGSDNKKDASGNSLISIDREKIESVKFVDLTRSELNSWAELATSTENATHWDVSARGDKSIVAHYTDTDSNGAYEVEIGSYWEIFANQNSSYLLSYVGYSADCDATETVTDLNKLNTSSVTNMAYMFNNFGHSKLETLNLGEFDTTNVTNMESMFNGCGNKEMGTLNLGTSFKTNKVTNMKNMFNGCGQTQMDSFTIGGNFDTTLVTDMSGMFQNFGTTKLETLSLGSSFKTNNVTDMSNMFNGCGTSLLTTFSFGSSFNTAKVKYMNGMFQNFGHKLTTLDLGATGVTFNTSLVENMSNMFNGCGKTSMTTLNLGPHFNTATVTNMSGMFQDFAKDSSSMKNIDLGNQFYTTAVTDMSNMFNACGASALTVLDLGPHFIKIPTTRTDMFKDCGTSQLKIYAPESIYETQTSFK